MMRPTGRARPMAIAVSVALAAGALAPAALADTIYMRDGAQLSGTILQETETQFVILETSGKKVSVNKQDIDFYPRPNPMMAFIVGLLMPGAGHIYNALYNRPGGFERAALFFGIGAVGAGASAAYAIKFATPATAPFIIGTAVGIPTLIGAIDAFNVANDFDTRIRYRIDYSQPSTTP